MLNVIIPSAIMLSMSSIMLNFTMLNVIMANVAMLNVMMASKHRHLSNIDFLKVSTACLVCCISALNGHRKKEKEALKNRR
jgi:hypothetical protein